MKETINLEILRPFLRLHPITSDFHYFFSQLCIQNRYKYSDMNASSILQISEKINNQVTIKRHRAVQTKANFWKKGEFKLFVWFIAFYSFSLQLPIQEIKPKDFHFFSTIFAKRCASRMQYEFKSLFRGRKSAKSKWQPSQIQLLKKIVEPIVFNDKTVEWKSVAYELFLESQGSCFKTFGQCRQMWNNHLNLTIKKDKWSAQQDELLLQLAEQHRKHWSRIADRFQGRRSCHMVKNRYFSLMRKKKQLQRKELAVSECFGQNSMDSVSQESFGFFSPSILLTLSPPTQTPFLQQTQQTQSPVKQKSQSFEPPCQEQSPIVSGSPPVEDQEAQRNVEGFEVDRELLQRDSLQPLRYLRIQQIQAQFKQQWDFSPFSPQYSQFINSYL